MHRPGAGRANPAALETVWGAGSMTVRSQRARAGVGRAMGRIACPASDSPAGHAVMAETHAV
ncbi:hypothetical protein BVIET440_60153 [Burkholderia vietnamiensis]